MKAETANISLLWTAVVGTALGVLFMFNTFASQDDVDSLHLSIWYGQYYDHLDDYDEAKRKGNEDLASEHSRQMERLRAKICAQDPEWERCE